MEDKFTDLYNKTGIPFQYWCLSILRKVSNYQGIPEFSFTHPSSSGAQLGKSSSADILALKIPARNRHQWFNGLVLFSIECKRANPEIKNWVFSKDPSKEDAVLPTYLLKIVKEKEVGHIKLFEHTIKKEGVFPGLGYNSLENLDCCLHGVEFNNDLTNINRNQNEIIYKSLLQTNHALNALFCKFKYPFPNIEGLYFPGEEEINKILFLPIVITTANLFIANYDPIKVDFKTGKIDQKDIKFNGPRKWLTYEFPLPDYLKHSGEISCIPGQETTKILINAERITTFIVNSEHWAEFLQKFSFFSSQKIA